MTFFNRNVRSGVYHNIQTSDKIGYTNVTPPMFLTVRNLVDYWDERRDVVTVEFYLTNSNHKTMYSHMRQYCVQLHREIWMQFQARFPFCERCMVYCSRKKLEK